MSSGDRVANQILVAGELNADLVLRNYQTFPALGREVLVEDVALALGSASAICAAGLARLGNKVVFAGRLGCDSWGDLCLTSLTSLDVDCSLVVRDLSVKTGLTVSITSAKDRALVTYLGSIAELRQDQIEEDALRACRHLHVSSFFLQRALRPGLKALFARAHRLGLTTSLDPGFDPEECWGRDLIDVLNEVDVFLPNQVELECITGDADRIRALHALENGRTLTVAKLGGEGCLALEGKAVISTPAFRVQPIDTTGAGDSFNAGFLHAWLQGTGLRDAMRFGSACGALSTLSLGGTAGQPDEQQARNFISAQDSGEMIGR
jgi:sugar/nucleoside kinase (ribokinase family)